MAIQNRIVNISNEPIEACAVFEYRGYQISASSIFSKAYIGNVEVTANGVGEGMYFDSVEEAINTINHNTSTQ